MGAIHTSISPKDLIARIGTRNCPLLFDVCRAEVCAQAAEIIPTARWRDHMDADAWGRDLHTLVRKTLEGIKPA